MRISIIGPVAPFRSGIARHTTALAQELAQRGSMSVSVTSFKRQYPRRLYPGENERDERSGPPAGLETDFCIDSLDPRTWRKAARRIRKAQPDLCLIPSWTFFLAPCLGWIARDLRRHGIRVVAIIHNAEDHEAAGWKQKLSRFQLRQADSFVTHNAALAADLERLAPGVPVAVHPHPVYDDYPEPKGTLPRKAALELLFFGLVRPYKGLDIGLRALAASGLQDVRLTIAGEFWEGREETEALIEESGLRDRVELHARYASDEDAAEYFARADVVIAPYRSATGSGVVALAQWYGCPVLASDVPGLAEAIEHGRTGWLFEAGNPEAMAILLDGKTVSRDTAESMRPAIEAARADLTWKAFADTVIAFGQG